ncbi:hypothetical protein HHK36_003721 [Tetracentron sinense]|uniref:Tyrosinase copper-binding domain-containing protein n=1 Tax=Tetracentron sinense TaxID=13715 RepID=A0A835DNV5_TETSI|nr:hypothetical protein HHK36_003721 [Tetracentron sinense]
MASLSPLNTTTTIPTTVFSSTPPFFQKRSLVSIAGKRNRRFFVHKVSCNARDGDQKSTQGSSSSSNNGESCMGKMDRRNVLVGLGGLYGAAGLSADRLAFGAPIMPPDLAKCGPADLPAGATMSNCCPPTDLKIIDFKLPSKSTPLRVRQAAHLVDDKYKAKYAKALALMKALPDDDPRSFKQQAMIHCAYCDGAYDQIGFPDLELQVHNSWLFFPFHRYYLYFYEKILGKLIDDPTFALPFWNWDSPPGMQMPSMYVDPNSPLYDTLRDALHQPPTLVDLDYDGTDPTTTEEQQLSSNLAIMYRQVVSNKTAKLFLGEAYRAGDQPNPGAGSLENVPHGPVHLWTGDRNQPNKEDMGNFYSAGRDPIFYSHHSNVDRMWTLWKSLGGKRNDFTDSDWLDSGFLFYDENAQLVRVKVRDCLDQSNLRYKYQEVDIPWLKSKPTPRNTKAVRAAKKKVSAKKKKEDTSTFTSKFPITLDSVVRVIVQRPKKTKRTTKEKEEEEEILVLEGIELKRDAFVKFDIYINDEDEKDQSKPDKTEFAGSFVNIPHHHKHGTTDLQLKTSMRMGITDLLEDLDAEDDETVVVTLVPRQGDKGVVTIAGISIELAS